MKKMYEMAPTTDRGPLKLARAHGYENIDALSESLPEDARVVDFGSGNSLFGVAIARRREDVQVFNVDLWYRSTRVYRRAQRRTPPNVQFVAGDALHAPFAPGTFDRVYSTAMLPHILLTDEALGRQAIEGMARLLKPEGRAEFAFTPPKLKAPVPDNASGFARFTGEQFAADPQGVTAAAAEQMAAAPGQKAINVVGHYLGFNAFERTVVAQFY